jgi:hypothetical protein
MIERRENLAAPVDRSLNDSLFEFLRRALV